MQGTSWANGQCQQVGQPQLTHPSHLSHTTSSNHGRNTVAYFLQSSNNEVGEMFSHFKLKKDGTKQVSIHRQNVLTANNHLPASGHQGCFSNSTATFTTTPTVDMNTAFRQQVPYAENTSMSGNSQSSSMLLHYHEPQVLHQGLNQNLKTGTDNVIARMQNSTSASTRQAVYHTQQQTPLQSCMYSQSSQQTAGGPHTLPSYSQATSSKNLHNASSHVASTHNVYSVTPVMKFSTSCVNKSSNDQHDQANYIVPQTNAVQAVIGCIPFLTNNVTSLGNSLMAVPVQINYNSYQDQEHMQQPTVRGNRNLQTTQPVMLTTNFNASSMELPSQTCLPENRNERLHLNNTPAPPQITTNMSTNDHAANPSVKQKISSVPSVNQDEPLTRASQINRVEAFEKIVLTVQTTNGATLTSPGRAQRAVAVVMPLSQESVSDNQPSSTSKIPPNATSGPCILSSNQTKDTQLHTPDALCLKEKTQPLTTSCNISSKNTKVQSVTSSLKQLLSINNPASRVSDLPLTFAKLVNGTTPQISEKQKRKSGNRKTPTETKPCEEPLSSVPTTEWTLKKLYSKILGMEKENEKSENKNAPDGDLKAIKQMLIQFWNSDFRLLLRTLRAGNLFHQTKEFKELCRNVDQDTVILSQIKSQDIQKNQYHVLQHDEVYQEKIPYASSWLNINSQLDDIDKEFGLPCFLKYNQYKEYGDYKDADNQEGLEDNCQTGLKSVNSEEPITQNAKSDNGIKSVDSKGNIIDTDIPNRSVHSETNSPKESDPNQCESNVESSDSSYSFKIEVLPPEKAKVIFEQMDCNSPQNVGCCSPLKTTAPNDQNDAKGETCNAITLEMVCCIEKWKEKVLGLASEGKCTCNVLNEDKEPQSHNAHDNSWPMGFFDLTEDDRIPIVPLKVTGDIQEARSPNNSAILVLSEDESKVSEDNQTSHSNNNEQDFAKSAEDPDVTSADKNALETLKSLFCANERTVSETACIKEQEMKEQEVVCRMEKEDPTTVRPVSTTDGVKEHGKKSDGDVLDQSLKHPSKKIKPSSHLRSQTIYESFSKCKNTAPITTVELALFGSRQEKGNRSWRKTIQPPERIYVKTNPLTRSANEVELLTDKEAESLSNMSAKRRIHETWMKSFPLGTIKIKKKNKKFAIVGHKISLSSYKLKLKGVCSKRKVKDSDERLPRKIRRTCNVENSVTLLKEQDIEVKSLQENVLKYNVLPSTFSFQDGSKTEDLITDSTAADEKTVSGKAEEKSLVLKTQGAWCDESSEKSPPQSPTSSPESLGLFQEFQRRHKMRQMSTDE